MRGDVPGIVGSLDADAHDPFAAGQKVGDFGLHEEMKIRELPGLARNEIEELPLRHEHHELAARRKLREIADHETLAADFSGNLMNLVMRALEEGFEQAHFGHQFQCGGMDGVAAKVAQEVLVLLEHDHVDAGARQKIAAEQSRRTAADD